MAAHDPIDISTATEDELLGLVGVGPNIARSIVEWREANGGFTSVEELARVRGIGAGRLDLIRPQVTLALPAEIIEDAEFEELDDDVVTPSPARAAGPRRAGSGPRRVLAGRRLPAVMDPGGSGGEPERSVAAFLRDNTASLALVGVAVAAQLLVIVLVVWVL